MEETEASWSAWPFEASNALAVQGYGFWISLFGVMLTAAGFLITFIQLRKTQSAAEAAKKEALRIETSLKRYDAAHDISKAQYALRKVRKHFGNGAWGE